MRKSDSISSLALSLKDLQGELKPVPRTATNPFLQSKYADLSSIWETCRPLLQKYGFALSQLPAVKDGQFVLTTVLLHAPSGEWLASSLPLTPVKEHDPQALGSALTYARRYALSAMLGVCSEEDDDAEGAMDRSRPAKAKADAIPATTKASPLVAEGGKVRPGEGGQPAIFANPGAFMTMCATNLKLNQSQVLAALNVPDLDNVNLGDAYEMLKEKQREAQQGKTGP